MLWVRGGSKPLPLPLWGFLGGSTRVRDGQKRGFRSPRTRVPDGQKPRILGVSGHPAPGNPDFQAESWLKQSALSYIFEDFVIFFLGFPCF